MARRDDRSAQAKSYRYLYKSRAWQSLRISTFINDNGQCRMCKAGVKLNAPNGDPRQMHCDHIKAHKGDTALFFDASNLRTLCASCHNSHAQAEDKGSKRQMIGVDGWPVQ